MNKAKIQLAGREFKISSDQPVQQMMALSEDVNKMIRDIQNSCAELSQNDCALLAAYHFASRVRELEEANTLLTERVDVLRNNGLGRDRDSLTATRQAVARTTAAAPAPKKKYPPTDD